MGNDIDIDINEIKKAVYKYSNSTYVRMNVRTCCTCFVLGSVYPSPPKGFPVCTVSCSTFCKGIPSYHFLDTRSTKLPDIKIKIEQIN